MYNIDRQLEVGMATVTSEGILFRGEWYSSRLVLKDGWFEYAEKNGEWEIPVFYSAIHPDNLIIVNYQFVDFAYKLNKREGIDDLVLESYFEAFSALKEQMRFFKND